MEDTHNQQPTGDRGTPLLKRKRIIFAGGVVALAIGFLAYMGVSQFATYYVTVSEFVDEGYVSNGKQVRVGGQIVPESLERNTEEFALSFTLTDGEATLPVVYRGVVPDTFRADNDVIVEGKSGPQGVFNASKLITKCPSKYEPSE